LKTEIDLKRKPEGSMSPKMKARCVSCRKAFLLWPVLFLFSFLPGYSANPAFADWSPLVARLTADGFDEQAVQGLFSRPEVQFEPGAMKTKMEELLRNRAAVSEPPPASPRKKGVMKGFLKTGILAKARAFIREHRPILEDIHATYGVPKEIVVSILLVETRLGEYVGSQFALNRLASMALCTDLERVRPYISPRLLTPRTEDYARERCMEKANWAYDELKALLTYTEKSGMDPVAIPGSTYGAIGLCQFMPSNIALFGVDADQDGRIDLFTGPDALHSIANYLRGHGWSGTMPKSSQQKVIFAYNHSSVYANTVLAVADRLKEKGRAKTRLG
jgi:membrane-bound lytic murein transglycosylase B